VSLVRSLEDAVDLPTPVGRPRDATLDHQILEVVRTLLVEYGYEGWTMQDVTRRSAVHVRTIKLRWSTKAELVAAAILEKNDPVRGRVRPKFPTGELDKDLESLVRSTLRYLSDPVVRVAQPALWAEQYVNSGVRDQLDDSRRQFVATVRELLQRAEMAGSVPVGASRDAEVVALMISGTAFSIQSAQGYANTKSAIRDVVSYVIAGLSQGGHPH
jgi:AcrR family transcriptional regulator